MVYGFEQTHFDHNANTTAESLVKYKYPCKQMYVQSFCQEHNHCNIIYS